MKKNIMYHISKTIQYNWEKMLLIFGVLMIINFLATSGLTELTRQGLWSSLGLIGGSALLGYALITLGGFVFMIPAGWTQIAGVIMVALGFILAGASIVSVWVWIKSNWIYALLILAGLVFIWKWMTSRGRPKRSRVNYHEYNTYVLGEETKK